MIKKMGLCCTLALMVATGCKDRKLSDDLEWMDNTYNSHEGINIGHGRSGWYVHGSDGQTESLSSGTIDSFKNNGCDFQFHSETDPADSVHTALQTSSTLKVNLHDLDPDSVKVRVMSHFGGFTCADYTADEITAMQMTCDHAEMTAFTRNHSPVVLEEFHAIYPNLTGKEHETVSTSKGPEVFLGLDNPDYAQKFAGVFKDAVKRCGGTKGAAS